MVEEYGDPKANDATARNVDARVNRIGSRFVLAVQRAGKNVLNRPPGSKVLSLPEQREDYEEHYRGNVPAKVELLQRMISQVGPVEAAAQYSQWVQDMEKD